MRFLSLPSVIPGLSDYVITNGATAARNTITGNAATDSALVLKQGSGGFTTVTELFAIKNNAASVTFVAVYPDDSANGPHFTINAMPLWMADGQAVRFYEAASNGTNYVAVASPSSLSANYTVTHAAVTGTNVVAATTSTTTSDAYFSNGTAGGATCRAIAESDLPIGVVWTTVVQASDESRTSTTVYADANTLQLTGLHAGASYEFEILMVFNSAATSGVKVMLLDNDSVLASPSVATLIIGNGNNATRVVQGDVVGGNVQTSMASVATATALLKGYLTIGESDSAQVYLLWAQSSSNATPMNLLAGSFAKWRRVS